MGVGNGSNLLASFPWGGPGCAAGCQGSGQPVVGSAFPSVPVPVLHVGTYHTRPRDHRRFKGPLLRQGTARGVPGRAAFHRWRSDVWAECLILETDTG